MIPDSEPGRLREPLGASSQWREPELHRKVDGWLMICSTGDSYFLEPMWYWGAQITHALATVKAWFAFRIIIMFGTGRINGLRWRLLPSAGDWAYRDDGGRLSDMAHFIDADLQRRAALRARASQEG